MSVPPCTRRAAVLALLLAAAVAGDATDADAQPASTLSPPQVLERVVLDRWLHEGQHPGFVPYDSVRSSLHLRVSTSSSIVPRALTLRLQGAQARLTLAATNHITSATIDQPALSASRYQDERTQAEFRRRRLQGPGAQLSLPLARLWEVPFVVPAAPLVTGLSWSDTLSFHTGGEGMSERLDGVWHNRVVGDTTIGGRSLPLVLTAAEVRYRAHELTADAALDTMLEVVRDVAGRMVGRAAIDTAAGVRAAGSDSTRLSGSAVLRMGDGRAFSSPIVYERRRSWLLRDSTAWAVVQDSLRDVQQRQSTGMLMLPRTELEERLRAGDLAVADSLFARWRDTDDPNERAAIRMLLVRTNARGTAGMRVEDRLIQLGLEAGDTAGAVHEALRALGQRPRYSTELLPYLDDPGRLWRLGVLPRFTYIELANQLMGASPILQPDSSRWTCAPAVCAAAIAMVETAAEPRLRDAALAGAFVRAPARWYPRLLARADSGSAIARNALRLAHGVGATWPAAPQAVMPEPGADWRTWLDWLGGSVRWGDSHVHALRIYAARTGRDPVQELLRVWPSAEDSARLVIGTILRGMDALPEPSGAELAAAFVTGSEADRRAAREQAGTLLRRNGQPASDALATELLVPFLTAVAARRVAPWPDIDHQDQQLHSYMVNFHGVSDVPVFVLHENLPAAVAAALPLSFTLISRDDWNARPQREGGVLITISPIIEWDGFVTVGMNWTVLRRRAANEAPSGYAGGGSYILLGTSGGWRIVSGSSWIT